MAFAFTGVEWVSGLVLLVVLVACFLLLFWQRKNAARELAEARRQVEVDRREAEIGFREEKARLELAYEKREAELEREATRREAEIGARERALDQERRRVAERESAAEERENALSVSEQRLDKAEHEAEKLRRLYRMKLHQVTRMDREEARRQLLDTVEVECREELRETRRKLLGRTESQVADEARRVLLAAMQRITSQPMNDATATVVSLPDEEMKGRIIGREGRNIRTFEHATGTTLMIDETPDSVLISCFDPVRRETARIALETLLRDGRIHPGSIEEAVRKAGNEMEANILQLGEDSLGKLRLHGTHPEVSGLLGKLHYRLSNNQNTLLHSIETANLCALLASEIGLDPVRAKRAGLFHDIGKALDEDYEGSHAAAGADFLRQRGEAPEVVNAVAAHHEEVPAESAYAGLVMVADSLSAVRPGARTASIDGFIQRVRSVEAIAREQKGVVDAYAIQAGREIRVLVAPDEVDDYAARTIARRIRQRIENELNYPGTVEITVIRERRYSETAT